MKGWKKTFYANNNQKRAEVAILKSDKIDFKSENSYKRQRMIMYIDSPRKHNNYKHMHEISKPHNI